MQTIASFAERLDMSAEEALEKLRYMLFEVESVDSNIADDLCDVLIDVDDDPAIADDVRSKKLAEIEKAEAAAAKKKAAADKKASAAKKKAAAKKKTATKKKETKKKATTKKTAAKKTTAKKKAAEADGTEIVAAKAKKPKKKPVAEILPSDEEVAAKAAKEPEGPAITIGTAIEHEERSAEIVRADGTHLDVTEVEGIEDAEPAEASEEEGELGLLAQAERQQEEEDKLRAKERTRPAPAPDPNVVAEVIRKAKEKKGGGRPRARGRDEEFSASYSDEALEMAGRTGAARQSQATRRTGKTARKRQRKLERMRTEEALRRSAAAAVKEYESGALDAGPKKRRKKRVRDGEGVEETPERLVIEVEDTMSVEALAQAMGIDTTDIILELMERNIMATKNQTLAMDLVRAIAEPQGYEVVSVIPEEEDIMAEEPDNPANLEPRAPVITVMGHVDHGKTSLLDQVRKATVAEGEAGGITQHIAAYEVQLPQGRVVFLDTPGHEAFTAMRARGAHVTDVVVLVVAADDGVMPQTKEAIDHAKAAEVPIVVAVNKCDKPDAAPDRIRQELTQFGLTDEKWGGDTIVKDISAKTGDHIDELMELLVLETELLELRADPKKRARGTVIESEVTRGLGPVAWVLVQSGTLNIGDIFIAGESFGRVRSMQNSRGENVQVAGPATPVAVTGFDSAPAAGDLFVTLKDERAARSIAEKRRHRSKLKEGVAARHVTLEDFHAQLVAGEKAELNVVVKADVQGSVDVLESSLPKMGNEEVQVKIVHSGVGGINESDVLLASASDAVILGFHVEPATKALKLAQTEGVDIRTYKVIYEMTEDVRKSLEGLLAPEKMEVVVGHAEIRQVFKSSALGNIAGCYQLDGETRRDSLARVLRNNEVIYEGRVSSLRREKDSVAAVQTGFECGITLANFDGIEPGDVIEVYRIEEVAKTLV